MELNINITLTILKEKRDELMELLNFMSDTKSLFYLLRMNLDSRVNFNTKLHIYHLNGMNMHY